MYVKVFASMFGSTVNDEPLHVRWTWVGLLTIPQDEDGIVDMTTMAIARYVNLPLVQVEDAIAALSRPDPLSRSEAEGGRRLIPIRDSYGWKIVNFRYYRNLQRAADRREYQRDLMRRRRGASQSVSDRLAPVSRRKQTLGRLADTEAIAIETILGQSREDLFEERWQKYPKKDGKKEARRHFLASIHDEATLALFDVALDNYISKLRAEQTAPKFIKNGSTFFGNWQDYAEWQPAPAAARRFVA